MKSKKQHQKAARTVGTINPLLLLGIGILVVLAFLGINLMRPDQVATISLSPEITVAEAAEMWEAGTFVLDVRQPEEWVDHHIPGTTLIPLGELGTRLNELPRDQEIVVVCRSGNRSATGRDILLQAGFEQVTSMAGGLNAWKTAGYTTVSGP